MQISKRIVRIIAGWIFIALGIAGLVLPILQGILFLAIGVILLAPDVPFFGRIQEKFKERYPKAYEKAMKLQDKISRKISF